MSKLEWIPTKDEYAEHARTAQYGKWTLSVYPPGCGCVSPGWCGKLGTVFDTEYVTFGTCTSLEDGIAKAEAWLAERKRQENPLRTIVSTMAGPVAGVSIGARPAVPVVQTGEKSKPLVFIGLETDDQYRARLIEAYSAEYPGARPLGGSPLLSATGAELDHYGETTWHLRRQGSDLPTNAPVCNCGFADGKAPGHLVTCPVLDAELHAQGITVSRNGDAVSIVGQGIKRSVVTSSAAGYIDKAALEKAGGFGALIAKVDSDSKPSLRERLARELRLDPCADEEVVFSTAAKRLAAPLADLNAERERSKRLTSDINVANRMRETVINKLSDLEIRCRNQSIQLGEMSETIRMQAREIERLRKGGKR